MTEPMEIWAAPMTNVDDKELRNKLRPFIHKRRGAAETNLQKIDGAPIYIWYGNSQTSVIWRPISEPIFYEAKP